MAKVRRVLAFPGQAYWIELDQRRVRAPIFAPPADKSDLLRPWKWVRPPIP